MPAPDSHPHVGLNQPVADEGSSSGGVDGVTIEHSPKTQSIRVVQTDHGACWMYSYWFAWHAFWPGLPLAGPEVFE